MPRIRASLLAALSVTAISVAMLAHPRAANPESASVLPDEIILNAPYQHTGRNGVYQELRCSPAAHRGGR
jgi:hypothetical protein